MSKHLTATAVILIAGQIAVYADQPAKSADAAAKPMLSIAWKRGPDLPQGFQDSDGGILGETLISVGGFCSGQKGGPGKTDRYPRGFLKRVWGLSLTGKGRGWTELPEFPGAARQGLDAVVVGDQLYCWGGFSYTEPFCYQDGFRLSRKEGGWQWDKLPPLPWVLTAQGSCAIGSKIYVVGGADYDGKTGFFSQSDRRGKVKRLGARLLMLDTGRFDDGWKELAACPGTPRFVHAVAAVGAKVYIFGGAASEPNPAKGTHTVVDNWRYDPAANSWKRLPDLPIASGNFPSGAIVFKDRYILLIGGYQYGKVQNADGSTRAVYGKPTRRYADNAMCSDVFVYDTKTDTFGSATPLPLNNNLPMAVVRGEHVHLIGGEIGGAVIDGEHYGHHPELYLIGTVKVEK